MLDYLIAAVGGAFVGGACSWFGYICAKKDSEEKAEGTWGWACEAGLGRESPHLTFHEGKVLYAFSTGFFCEIEQSANGRWTHKVCPVTVSMTCATDWRIVDDR